MTNQLKFFILILTTILTSLSCKNETQKKNQTTQTKNTESVAITGNYVSDGYVNRKHGSDWVSVAVTKLDNDKLNISVRSRADIKKPTCTFDATAQKVDDKTYETQIDGKSVLFLFLKDELSISTKNEADKDLLYFYCSGGASIAGTYQRIDEKLDETQIDKTQFSRVLNLQSIGFNISSLVKDGNNQLTVLTFGLPHDYNEIFDIGNNIIVNAEVEDLNADGSPELVVFAQSQDKSKKITVYAFSVNNQTSMSQVYFQPTEENKKINNGYNGNDEFALVENYLVQRFSIYKNGNKTDKMKQIQYKLVNGEDSRRFEIAKISEYDIK
ncbi:hypothetical protein [Marinifilum fragile]|uniref:hypothetical protein n=1 Tax=Marinifilum fragile TaxID=570161 RepID=UPI002AAAFE73|nr:hypothetical protein [Marinifilum fragile]